MSKERSRPPKAIASPCIDICVIHRTTGYCTGCLRTLDEIAGWGSFGDAERSAIMDTLPERKNDLARRRSGRARGRGRRRQPD